MAIYRGVKGTHLKESQLKDVKKVIFKVQKLSRLSCLLDKEAISFKNEIDKWRI